MDQRTSERVPTVTTVLYCIDDVVWRDTLFNISTHGCMMQADRGRAVVGDAIEVTLLPGVVAKGHVMWVADGALGVAFASPIGHCVVDYFRPLDVSCSPDEVVSDRFGRPLPPLADLIRANR